MTPSSALAPPSPTVVDAAHQGPPGCGNGGWVCGLLADRLEALAPATGELLAVQVRLTAPTPLDQPLRWEVDGAAGEPGVAVRLLHDDIVLGTARPAPSPSLEVPAPVVLDDARGAAAGYDLSGHPYPGCYVCGPDASAGLHIYAGAVAGRDGVHAAPVTLPDAELPTIFAALDCPGAFALGFGVDTLLLGTFVGHVRSPVPVGRELVVMSWEEGREGRRRHCGTALLDGERVLASAAATWVDVGRARIPGTAPAAGAAR